MTAHAWVLSTKDPASGHGGWGTVLWKCDACGAVVEARYSSTQAGHPDTAEVRRASVDPDCNLERVRQVMRT
jgi:hypothetical protein